MTGLIIYKIETFIILMLLGVIGAKSHVLKKESLPHISALLIKVIFPCLGFSLIYSAGTSLSALLSLKGFLVAELCLSAFLLALGFIMSKVFRLPNSTRQIFVIQTMFGNQGFMHIPILMSLFVNGEANIYIALFTFVDQVLLWSLGVIIMSSSSGENGSALSLETLKKILNPMNVSMVLAMALVSLGIQLPEVLTSTITSAGNTCFSLGLLFLGANLAYISLKNLRCISSYIFLVVVKMIAVPIAVALVCHSFLSPMETTILTLMAGMPAMSSIPMMAINYHSDTDYASQTVLVMTAASALTLPLVFAVIGRLGIVLG